MRRLSVPPSPAPPPRPPRRLAALLIVACLLGPWPVATALAAGAVTTAPTTAQATPESATPAADAAAGPAPFAADDIDVRGRFDAVSDEIRVRLGRLLASLPLLLAAAAIVYLAALLGRLVSQRLHWLRLRTRNPYLDGLLRRMVHGGMVVAGILVALDLLNATALVGALLGSAGVLGLALGFAFKDIAENYIAGILLSLRRPFSPGDTIRVDSHEGRVAALSARDMVLVTAEGNELRLPNAMVFKAVLLNFSTNPQRRFEFAFDIDASESIRKAQDIALEEITGIEGVLATPAPSSMVVESGAAGVSLRFFGWIDQRHSDLGKIRSEAIRLVKGAFWRAGIEAPRSINHVMLARADAGQLQPHRIDVEPATSAGVDTSVNRDIDHQVAIAQNQDENLLPPKDPAP